ncbi:hypothetical protein SCATT_p07740 (plasmid) [Streptantibioticus cattleyicolor NRRL 8057 = DSM 46488]|uniref:Uncharacterized protein n=1 Tax=Streptantibioticus cattleyicolor (strain ATCC 35852 / DSM 46488 / JCM 4925 / NBRC 14057 / NRRL 8057) TaxID=1003195 RepID=G8XHV2_STREN|nr:hypothetical protein SCATT_p07740 [Streptantibioticus cattleyicolor NRRL 8057 = DSM 46488]
MPVVHLPPLLPGNALANRRYQLLARSRYLLRRSLRARAQERQSTLLKQQIRPRPTAPRPRCRHAVIRLRPPDGAVTLAACLHPGFPS